MYNQCYFEAFNSQFGRKSIFVGKCGDISKKVTPYVYRSRDPFTRVTLIAVQVSLVS